MLCKKLVPMPSKKQNYDLHLTFRKIDQSETRDKFYRFPIRVFSQKQEQITTNIQKS